MEVFVTMRWEICRLELLRNLFTKPEPLPVVIVDDAAMKRMMWSAVLYYSRDNKSVAFAAALKVGGTPFTKM